MMGNVMGAGRGAEVGVEVVTSCCHSDGMMLGKRPVGLCVNPARRNEGP